jgi:hypothetical protein
MRHGSRADWQWQLANSSSGYYPNIDASLWPTLLYRPPPNQDAWLLFGYRDQLSPTNGQVNFNTDVFTMSMGA